MYSTKKPNPDEQRRIFEEIADEIARGEFAFRETCNAIAERHDVAKIWVRNIADAALLAAGCEPKMRDILISFCRAVSNLEELAEKCHDSDDPKMVRNAIIANAKVMEVCRSLMPRVDPLGKGGDERVLTNQDLINAGWKPPDSLPGLPSPIKKVQLAQDGENETSH